MADTARTPASILSLFADNTAGDISAQDLRDFVESVRVSYGLRHVDPSQPPIPEGTSSGFALIDAHSTFVDGGLRNFTSGTGMTLNYTGPGIGGGLVAAWGSVVGITGSTPSACDLRIARNGTGLAGSIVQLEIDNERARPWFTAALVTSLANTDTLTVQYDSGTQDPLFTHCTMLALSLWGG